MNAKILSLGKSDFVKGAIMAVLTAIATSIYNVINVPEGQEVHIEILLTAAFWLLELKLSIGAFLLYIGKNFFTNSKDQFLKPEQDKLNG